MKRSEVPNRLSYPPPKRAFPLQSPELCYRDKLGPPQHPLHPLGPVHSLGFVPSSPASIGAPTNRCHHTGLGPPQHSVQAPKAYCSSPFVPFSPSNIGTSTNRPQPSTPSIFHQASPQFMKDLSNHSLSPHIKRVQVTESKVTLSHPGSKTVTAKSQEKNKAQSSDVQQHRAPVIPSLNSRAAQEVYPPSESAHLWTPLGCQLSPSTQSSDRGSGSSVPIPHSHIAPCQGQQHKRASSSEKSIPVELNCLSKKRPRDFEDNEDNAKKLCFQGANSGKAKAPKPTGGNLISTSPKTTESHLCTESAFGQATSLEPSSTIKSSQSFCTSLSPKPIKERPPMGAKQAYIKSSETHIVQLVSSSKPCEERMRRRSEDSDKRGKSNPLSPEAPQKETSSLPHVRLGSSHSGHTHHSTSALPDKTLSRGNGVVERNKTARPRRSVVIPDNADELFTPDPVTYVVSPPHKTTKSKIDRATIKLPTSEKSCSSSTANSSSNPVTGSLCHKTQNSTDSGSAHAGDTKVSFSAHNPQILMPTVCLQRVKPENIKHLCSKDGELKNSRFTSSGRHVTEESDKSSEKQTSFIVGEESLCPLDTNTTASKQTSPSSFSKSSPLERLPSEGSRKHVNEEDSTDVELGLNFELDLDLSQSSHSSEDEQLLSFQEMMARVTKPPGTPEKGAFSEPSTPGHHSCQLKTQPLPSTTNSGIYKNNLDQMLKEINMSKKAKEFETRLLTACQEDLLRIAEYEESEENQEEGISTEQQEFLQRYTLMSNAIREVAPGEVVFNLGKFGQIFNKDTLQLRNCMVNPQGAAQKTLLWSSPVQLRLHVNIGLIQEAYNCYSPCPAQVTRFFFKMMSVHRERLVSKNLLQALCDIAYTAAYQRAKKGSQKFKVWVPSLADVTLVLMNMGVPFVALFPLENLQPSFTEGDLLEDDYRKIESPSSNTEQSTFPEHNYNNVLKYMAYSMNLCPWAYSDDELLLLLTMVGRISLDTHLILQSGEDLHPVQHKVIDSIRDWDTMLPRICLALTDLTDDHHNMCLLVQRLPDNKRGKQLRRHLSLSMISKLLDGNCTYRPIEKEFQLSNLRPYLPRMQPSTLLRGLLSSSSRSQKDKEEDTATLDQQAYYLCYSLLTLANEASNFYFFSAHQKGQLLLLCSELETHVKCDIRESEKCLYRSKVKDLVARISTKWQMLLQRTRPLHDKLYDYWQPLPEDTPINSQEEQEMDSSDDGEDTLMEGDEQEEESSGAEDDEAKKVTDDEERLEAEEDMMQDGKLGENDGDSSVDDSNETKEAMDQGPRELNQDMPETEPQVHKEAGNTECIQVNTENTVDMRTTTHHNQIAAYDLVS
uniref:SMC5-SMC6 complex localization factor protein 2 isoform X2 n=1 Tax=Monopterus albus TaxID=43700 RepID=UPI0009B43C97|nr:SMC5-SMC6 complex localization factor protein 2-like isoform X2 [Monopterus albus]